jgi:hypothetical protein
MVVLREVVKTPGVLFTLSRRERVGVRACPSIS